MGVVTIQPDDADRRRRIISLTETYGTILKQFVNDCSKEFRDLIRIHDRNEREKAEESLAESEERFRDLVEGSIQGTMITQNGKLLFANQAAANILGYATPQDLIALPDALETVAPHDRKRVKGYRAARLRGDEVPSSYEYQGLRKDGSLVWLENQARVVSWRNEAAIQIVFVDISERRRAEERLRVSEARFRALFENANAAINIKDGDGRIILSNQKYKETFSADGQLEEVGKTIYDVHDRELADFVMAIDRKVVANGSSVTSERRIPFVDGSVADCIINKFPIPDPLGNDTWVGSVVTDITDLRAMEQKFGEKEAQLGAFFESAIEALFIKDVDLRYSHINQFGAEFFGFSVEEIIGKMDAELFPAHEADIISAMDRKVLAGNAVREEVVLVRGSSNRSERWIETVKAPVRDHNGNVVGLCGISRDISDRKKAEENLRWERDQTTEYLEVAEAMIVSLDIGGMVTLINRRGCEVLGYTQDEIIGRNWFDTVIPEDEREKVRAIHFQIVTGETEPFDHFENEVLTKGGERRFVAWHNTVIREDGGNIICSLSSGQDITDRKKAEAALKLSEQNYRLLVENQTDLVVKVDTDGCFLFVSPSYCQTFDKSETELLGNTFMPLVHEDDREVTAKAMANLFVPPHTAYMEQRAKTKDGWRWFAWNDTAVLDEKGEVSAIIGVGRDITSRREVELAVAESEERFSKAFHSNPVAMAVSRIEDGRLVDVNQAWLSTLGYIREEVIGKTAAEKSGWATLENRSVFVDRLNRDGSVHGFTADYVTKDGKLRNVILFGDKIEIAGEPRLLMASFDVTERKALEHQLIQSKKMEAVGQLTGGIAHHFNNVFQAIQCNLELVRSSVGPNSNARKPADNAINVVSRGAEMIQRLLAFSNKSMPSTMETVEPKALIAAAFSSDWQELDKGIEIAVSCEDETPMVLVDVDLFGKALLAIASNAKQAMPNGGKLSIRSRRRVLDNTLPVEGGYLLAGEYAEIVVTDEGCGMPQEILDRAIEPFFTTREVGKGNGLGLSMAQGIVQQSGGAIILESEIGRGTIVRMLVPAADAADVNGDN